MIFTTNEILTAIQSSIGGVKYETTVCDDQSVKLTISGVAILISAVGTFSPMDNQFQSIVRVVEIAIAPALKRYQ